ncbi:hypothetical protein QJQ45_029014, partial [Haematococcus lacustris]
AHKSPISAASTRKLHVLSGRLSRRDFFHTPAELRSDADLLAIDELLWAAPACSVMTRQARLRVAQQTTLMELEAGATLCSAGQPAAHVYFLLSGCIAWQPQGPGQPSTPRTAWTLPAPLHPPPPAPLPSLNPTSNPSIGSSSSPNSHPVGTVMLQPGSSLGSFLAPARRDCITPCTRAMPAAALAPTTPHHTQPAVPWLPQPPLNPSASWTSRQQAGRRAAGAPGAGHESAPPSVMGVLEDCCWAGSATAVSPVEVAVVSQAQWQAVMAQEPRWDARELAEFLEDLPLMGRLSRTQLLSAARVARCTAHHPGASIYRQESEGSDVFVIRSGFVRLLRELPVSDELCVRVGPSVRDSINSLSHTLSHLRESVQQLSSPGQAHQRLPHPSRPTKARVEARGPELSCLALSRSTSRPAFSRQASLLPVNVTSPGSLRAMKSSRFSTVPDFSDTDASGAPDGEAPVANVGAPALHRQSYVDTSHPGTRAPPRLALNIGAVSAEASKEVLQPRTPRLLQAAERQVRVELDTLGAGKVFGFTGSRGGSQANALGATAKCLTAPSAAAADAAQGGGEVWGSGVRGGGGAGGGGSHGTTGMGGSRAEGGRGEGGPRSLSAEADTRVELVQWSRAEVEAKLGPLLSFLWNPMETEGSLAASHSAMKAQLLRTMKWEVFKKKMVCSVLVQKHARTPRLR